jgi:hypothetical protein
MNYRAKSGKTLNYYFIRTIVSFSSFCLLLPSNSWSHQKSVHTQNSIELSCSDYLNRTTTSVKNFESNYKPNLILDNFDPREALFNLGLNPKKVQFLFVKEYYLDSDALLVQILYNDHVLGQMTLIQDEKINSIWHTDLTLLFDDNFKSKGLGFLMYLIAAARFYQDYPNFELHGSADQSEDAKKLWQRLINSDFAEKLNSSQTELDATSNYARIIKANLGQKLKTYVKLIAIITPRID